MVSVETDTVQDSVPLDDDTDIIYILDITNGTFPQQLPDRIESGDIIEFKTDKTDEFDIFQVYKDGNDYYRTVNGFELFNISSNTPKTNRRITLSLALHQPKFELYFCIIPSSRRQTIFKSRKCPVENCGKNCLTVHKSDIKFSLSDNKESQKLTLHKGDTIELEWISKRGNCYRIEEKKYCPISGGLYTVEQSSDVITSRALPKGTFRKTFNEFGTSFLFRLTDTNRIHDIIACVVKSKFNMKFIDITDDGIQPQVMTIEQNDSIIFQWNVTGKQTIQQIEPFIMDQTNQSSIEVHINCFFFEFINEIFCFS